MATQTVDDLLMQLMVMGFELPDCQDAVQYGKVTVEEAVEWILAGKPGMTKIEAQPTLKLAKGSTEGLAASSQPFVNPVGIPEASTSVKPDVIGQATAMPANEEAGDCLVSRLHMNDEQRKVKNKFEERVRDEAQRKAKEEKMKAKQEKARILQQIAEDRDKLKMMRVHGPTSDHSADSQSPNKKAATDSAASPETKPADKCTLQIRLPDGRSLRQSFLPGDSLNTVWDFVYTKNKNILNMAFIQPFPRREFSKEEQKQTLAELGLTPTGSLVLQNRSGEPPQPAAGQEMDTGPPPEQPVVVANNAGDSGNEEEDMDNVGDLPLPPPGFQMPDLVPENPAHRWGRGQRMNNEEEEAVRALHGNLPAGIHGTRRSFGTDTITMMVDEVFKAVEGDEDDHEEDDDQGDEMLENILGRRFPHLPGIMGMGGMGGMAQQAFAGVGQMLVPDGHPGDERRHHNKPASQLAAEAASHRFVQPGPGDHDPLIEGQGQSLSYEVSSLLQLCILRVSRRLCDPRNPLLSLGGIAQDLAQKLLLQLMKEGKLKPKTLQVFVPCYLRRLNLDCYPYTTNELLQAIRYHVNLIHLSLNSCSLFTDQGLKPLAGLKKLKVLNLGSCRQLTNKCLPIVSELSNLQTLNLENTVISDAGMIEYLNHCSSSLLHINLNRTAVTHVIIPHLKALSKLKSLYLEQTKVCSLTGVQGLKELEVLDVAHTDIVTDSLLCLSGHPSLVCLSVANTEQVVGDLALQYLSGLKLHTLYLPSRHTTTSQGLSHIVGLPLTSLDLTNYINVGDEGMIHIGKITSLKKLLLSNTKITDEGILYLQGLVNLETLYLDRTLVSDVGAACIKAFTKLEELSLSSTSVTSKFLCSEVLNSCHFLSKLNLSRTSVSDKGLQHLNLMSLTLLNLDMTHVHPEVIASLQNNCPNIRSVTYASLNPIREEEEDMEL